MMLSKVCALAGLAVLITAVPASAAVLKANYTFGGTLASTVTGAPALTAVDPAGTNSFGTDTVFGTTRNVYNFTGSNLSPSAQGGLTFDDSGRLITNTSYSVEIVFKLNERNNEWRRIFDTLNRQSDTGFYVDPSNNLDVYPTSGSTIAFAPSVYYDVVLTNDNGLVSVYESGASTFTTINTGLNISADNVAGFFIDNVVGAGQGEWSSGSVSLISLYDGVLSPSDVATLYGANGPSAVPEPASMAVLALGAFGAGMSRRRR